MHALFALLLLVTIAQAEAQTAIPAPVEAAQETPACLFPRRGEVLDEPCLDLLAQVARTASGRILVRGFAQEQQGPRVDGLVSRRRAEAVAQELQRLGVSPDRLEVSTPAAEPRDAAQRLNPFSRRVEIEAIATP